MLMAEWRPDCQYLSLYSAISNLFLLFLSFTRPHLLHWRLGIWTPLAHPPLFPLRCRQEGQNYHLPSPDCQVPPAGPAPHPPITSLLSYPIPILKAAHSSTCTCGQLDWGSHSCYYDWRTIQESAGSMDLVTRLWQVWRICCLHLGTGQRGSSTYPAHVLATGGWGCDYPWSASYEN